MRLTVILLFGSLMAMSASTYSQNTRLNLSAKNFSLIDIFRQIEDQSEFYFYFKKEDVKSKESVSVELKDALVTEVLDQVLAKTGLEYRVIDRYVVVKEKGTADPAMVMQPGKRITGKVTDQSGASVPGASVVVKGTTTGVVTDSEGNYSLTNIPENATLQFSFVGMKSQDVPVGNKAAINVVLEEETIALDEIVAIGYGIQKKVNLTGAISIAGKKELENRPVANVQQALQGLVPGLLITTSTATGEPGGDMAMNIRGLTSIEGTNSPYVLVDGIPMGINDVNPSDIESISVLKDAASTAIYGARAAYGVILITTKSGKLSTGIRVSYSTNYARGYMLNQPEEAGAMDFALTVNDAAINAGGTPWYTQDALNRLAQNIAKPGSAPEVLPAPNGLSWLIGTDGLGCAANTDWYSLVLKKFTGRQKHNFSVSGGNSNLNFYLSGGFYNEDGLMKQAVDYYKRYNLDAKINAKVTPWMDLSFVAKYRTGEKAYPYHGLGRSFVWMLMTRLKPTKPAFYPGTNVWTGRIGEQSTNTMLEETRQLIVSPRISLTPVKGWVTTIELNYQTNDDFQKNTILKTPTAIPDGTGGSQIIYSSQTGTAVTPTMNRNIYMSPNIYSDYTKSFGQHNFHVLVGYQQEIYKYNNMLASAAYLLTDNVPAISTAVGTKTVSDQIGHWATQSIFGRFNYNFAEKYLLEFNYRDDGSSRFESGQRWGFFPSLSSGWVFSKEKFYPMEKIFDFFKLRGSYGSLGNQNVANYLYVPVMPIKQSQWLFNNAKLWTVGTPNFSSINLTWEKVNTLDFGVDIQSLNRRLGATFDWYESRTTNLVGPGEALSAILGTATPKKNAGEVRTRGWEIEISWRDKIKDFSYGFKGVLSDYRSTVTQYTNPTNILTTYYNGMVFGEIWGFETEGLFQSADEVAKWHDQQAIYSGQWKPGDVKYRDLNGDAKVNFGGNTKDNPGDRKVIGNNTPRYQFGLSADASWRGFDISILFQGVAKRDLDIRAFGTFRGPATAGLHEAVYKEHMDYWRDSSSPLGANPDAYFPKPYNEYIGQNGKNFENATDRYLQNGAYVRLKNLQLGYTIPVSISQKVNISKARIYVSGENLLTFTKLMIFDPEAFKGAYASIGDQYPLTQVFSMGLNINF